MKVKFLRNTYENGINYKIGDTADLEDKRAEALAKTGFVTILEKEKAVEKPKKNKMVKRTKNK